MNKKIRVGIIGLNPNKQWASRSHYPALKFLSEDFEIMGVANNTYESASRSASALAIPFAFKNSEELINSDLIDLVTITVKVPWHYDLVKLALKAGKHIYCEHPLAVTLEQVTELVELASKSNLVLAVGTQMACSSELIFLRQLIESDYVGKVLSTTVIGSGIFWGDVTTSDLYYMSSAREGATMLRIPVAHTLVGIQKVLGRIDELKAIMVNGSSTVKLKDTNEIKEKTSPDQIIIGGVFESNVPFSLHYRSGLSKATNFLWEINGTAGDLRVIGNNGHGQFSALTIMGANGEMKELEKINMPAEFSNGRPDNPMVRNVVNLYKCIARDIRERTKTAPTFVDSLELFKLLYTIETSAQKDADVVIR